MTRRFALISQSLPGVGFGGSNRVATNWYHILREDNEIAGVVTPDGIFNSELVAIGGPNDGAWILEDIDWAVVLHGWGFPRSFWRSLQTQDFKKAFRFGDEWPRKRGLRQISCDVAIYNSLFLQTRLCQIVSAKREIIIDNWTQHAACHSGRIDSPRSVTRFCFFGRIVEHKGPELIPKLGAALVVRGQTRFEIDIFGDGTRAQVAGLRGKIEQLGIGRFVRYRGPVEAADVAKTMSAYDALLFPSRFRNKRTVEGQPNVILEAWASGIPVVGNFYDGAFELVRPGEDSIAVNSDRVEDWCQVVDLILRAPRIVQRMKPACVARSGEYSVSKARLKIQELFEGSKEEPRNRTNSSVVDKPQAISFLRDIVQDCGLLEPVVAKRSDSLPEWGSIRDPLYLQFLERRAIGEFILGAIDNDYSDLAASARKWLGYFESRSPRSMAGACFALFEKIRPGCISDSVPEVAKAFRVGADGESPNNNHLLFHLIQSDLMGRDSGHPAVTPYLKLLSDWRNEDGLFCDGPQGAVDFYNTWGFFLFLPFLHLKMPFSMDFEALTHSLLNRFFDDDGYPYVFGRSLSYRLAMTGFFYPLGAKCADADLLVRLGEVWAVNYEMYRRSIGSIGFSIPGYLGSHVSEEYVEVGTPLWSLWGFLPLLFPRSGAFWDGVRGANVDIDGFWRGQFGENRHFSDRYNGHQEKLRNPNLYSGLFSSSIRGFGFPGANRSWPSCT